MSHLTRLSLIAALFAGSAPLALAQDNARVEPSQVVELEKFSACRRLKNNAPSPIFIPMRSVAEWATGTDAFLSRTPSTIRKGPCVDYNLTARVWGRQGPPGTPVFPYTFDPSPFGITTLSTLGAATGGGTATKSGNQFTYDAGTAFKGLGYLEKATVTVPWTGIDFEGVPEAGSANIEVFGMWEGNEVTVMTENQPGATNDYTLATLDGSYLVPDTPGISAMKYRLGTFEGDHVNYGLHHIHYNVNWAIIIDNSLAARNTYTIGASAGNPNGDGYSNTMLDAQINAASRFIDEIYAWQLASKAGETLTGLDDDTIKLMSNVPAGAGTAVNIYTANSNLALVKGGVISSTTTRDAIKTAIKGITHSSASNTNFATSLATLNSSHASTLAGGGTDFVNVLVLSPGTSNGTAFSTQFATLDGTTGTQKGFQFFAFGSSSASGVAGSAQNTVINSLDSSRAARQLTAVSSIIDRNIPHPVYISDAVFAFRNAADTGWDVVRDDAGALRLFPLRTVASNPESIFQSHDLRFSSRASWVCRTFTCGIATGTPSLILNEGRLSTADGSVKRVIIQFTYVMRPGYKAYNTRLASLYNTDGAAYKGLSYNVAGEYLPSPP